MSDQSPYARLAVEVEALLAAHPETDPTAAAYMIARLALLTVRALRGPKRAAEIAYKLADEFAAEVQR